MFLAKETGWSRDSIMEMDIGEVHYWVVEAVKLHNKLNKSE